MIGCILDFFSSVWLGRDFSSFLGRMCLSEACLCLGSGGVKVSEICFPFHFISVFKSGFEYSSLLEGRVNDLYDAQWALGSWLGLSGCLN